MATRITRTRKAVRKATKAVRKAATRRRRKATARKILTGVGIAAAAGAVILPLLSLIQMLTFGGFGIWQLAWGAAYAILVTSTVFYRLTGIQIR